MVSWEAAPATSGKSTFSLIVKKVGWMGDRGFRENQLFSHKLELRRQGKERGSLRAAILCTRAPTRKADGIINYGDVPGYSDAWLIIHSNARGAMA